jgi:isoleucyl-tRNA synthetase
MAPILSFTAEEVWQVLVGDVEQSIMFQTWHELPKPEAEGDLLTKWSQIRTVRAEVTKSLEALREAGQIGSSLQAEVELHCGGEKYELLASLADDLKFVLICSKAVLVKSDEDKLVAQAATHGKCERCWHVREDVGATAEHPTLCGRCVSNLYGAGEARAHA